ncbi:MAG TPA: universal stress protein [Gemmatimonadaceae bacterium]
MTYTNTSQAGSALATPKARPIGPILVAAKGERDEAAFRAARTMAERTGAPVRVISILEPEINFRLPLGFSLPLEYERDRSAMRLHALESEMMGVLGEGETLWPTDVRVGHPAAVLADAARREGASLVVMGIGRREGLQRLFGAETTLATIRRIHVPVLVVARDYHGAPRTVVAGVDFGAASIHALEVALGLLAPPATLHLVHSWPPIESVHPLLRAGMADYERSLPERFERLRETLHVPDGMTLHIEWMPGKAAEVLAAVAMARHADLVVLGRDNRRGLDRMVAGSTSTAVLRGATCSLLVAPEPPARDMERIEREVWGSSEAQTPDRWTAQLDAFTERNAGRRTALEVDDVAIGAQAQETGYVLRGASWDRRDRRIQLMFGEPGATTHLTRSIANVLSVTVLADDRTEGETLGIMYDGGQVVLRIVGSAQG